MRQALVFFLLFLLGGAYVLNVYYAYENAVGGFYSLNWLGTFSAIRGIVIFFDIALLSFIIFTFRQISRLGKREIGREAPAQNYKEKGNQDG